MDMHKCQGISCLALVLTAHLHCLKAANTREMSAAVHSVLSIENVTFMVKKIANSLNNSIKTVNQM